MESEVCGLIGHMFNIDDITLLLQYCKNFLFGLMPPFKGPKLAAVGSTNSSVLSRAFGTKKMNQPFKTEDGQESRQWYNVNTEETTIYRNSPTYKQLSGSMLLFDLDVEGDEN